MALIRIDREEGHYTIKRVPKLPKKGNANWLYAIIGNSIEEFYRWNLKNEWETIDVGGAGTTYIEQGQNISIIGEGTEDDPYTVSLIDIAAPTGETYMVTVDDEGLLSSDTIPGGGSVTNTSDLINDGEDGVNPFITEADIVEQDLATTLSAGNTANSSQGMNFQSGVIRNYNGTTSSNTYTEITPELVKSRESATFGERYYSIKPNLLEAKYGATYNLMMPSYQASGLFRSYFPKSDLKTLATSVNAIYSNEGGDIVLNSENVPYDNTDSGLTATDVQSAIDELSSGGGSTPGLQEVLDVSGYAQSSDSSSLFSVFLGNEGAGRVQAAYTNEDDYTVVQIDLDGVQLVQNSSTTEGGSIILQDSKPRLDRISESGSTLFTFQDEQIAETNILLPEAEVDGTYYLTHSINNQEADTTGNIDYTTEEDTGFTLNLSDNIAGKIFNEATPLVYEDDPFDVDNLKVGGYVINYIDTTGSTDFPALTNSAGDEILTKGDAFREDAVFKMIVSSPNGVDVEYFFVDYLNNSSPSYLENIVEDTTPQLGGDLDMNGFNINTDGNFQILTQSGVELYLGDDTNTVEIRDADLIVEDGFVQADGFVTVNGTPYLTGTTIDLTDEVVGKIYNEATPSTANNFTTGSLKTGGKAVNFIDTTGDSDFPTVNSSTTGFVAGAPFEAAADYMMVITSYDGTTYRYFFIKL